MITTTAWRRATTALATLALTALTAAGPAFATTATATATHRALPVVGAAAGAVAADLGDQRGAIGGTSEVRRGVDEEVHGDGEQAGGTGCR
ncbi:hypothetical protein [Kitasatospora sp. NPDC056731]|uniref:hypothetical protein n=1 Tax=Kitasatospora sp. NPDC056731 TaxID=3155422 RepID=UPI00342C9430